MRFIPKTEDEISSENLLTDGVYGFEIVEAEDAISKKGADMIHVKLRVFDGDGGHRMVDDYLLEALLFKVKHCADVCGLAEKYARGEFGADDLLNKTGHVKIATQPAQNGYGPKNTVKDYVAPKDAPARPQAAFRKPAPTVPAMVDLDDEIPF